MKPNDSQILLYIDFAMFTSVPSMVPSRTRYRTEYQSRKPPKTDDLIGPMI